jgi:hypothetical protein
MSQRPFNAACEAVLFPYAHFESMLELGNKVTNGKAWKPYFESLSIRHVSVDLNGKNGALNMDLQKPLNLGEFDIVTNFGTTEHVEDQEAVWRNIHEACGECFVSSTPVPGQWKDHGLYYPTEQFYRQFALLNGFEVDHLSIGPLTQKQELINVRMTRKSKPAFTMPDVEMIFVNEGGRFIGIEK